MAIKPRSWLRFHERNILREDATTNLTTLRPGQIIRFNYKGKHARVSRPLVLILNPYFRGKTHAITLDYISDRLLKILHNLVSEKMSAKIQKLTGLRLPLLKADIGNPQAFYGKQMKRFINTYYEGKESPYRTYERSGMTNVRVVDYRFRDMYMGSSEGLEEAIELGKTKKG
jgi:hypothetical protein